MLFLGSNEAFTVVDGHLENFRNSLYIMSHIHAYGMYIELLRPDPTLEEHDIELAEAILLYLQSRDFFFKEGGGFGVAADFLNTDPEIIRGILREEETMALEDGGLLDENFYKDRKVLQDIVNKARGKT